MSIITSERYSGADLVKSKPVLDVRLKGGLHDGCDERWAHNVLTSDSDSELIITRRILRWRALGWVELRSLRRSVLESHRH
jgi:hypothetical protein